MTPAPAYADDYRYERKFVASRATLPQIASMVRLLPGHFSEIFHPRQVNNIYFDTLGFKNYFESIDGAAQRKKIRVRWYGELFGDAPRPMLEIKKKQGLCGTKQRHRLAPFEMKSKISAKTLTKCLRQSNLPEAIEPLMKTMRPVLINKYKRSYWLSADKKFRITIDSDVLFYAFSQQENMFLHKVDTRGRNVVELKYARENDVCAHSITGNFGFRLAKNSKYTIGVDVLYRNQRPAF